jgi:hypothetical protein
MLGCQDRGKELSFCRAGGGDGLGLSTVGNDVGSIDKAVQGTGIIRRRERREICQSRQAFLRVGWEGRIKSSLLVGNTPGFGLSQVFCDLLEQGIMGVMGTHRELAQGRNSIANIRMACNIGIHEFTEDI